MSLIRQIWLLLLGVVLVAVVGSAAINIAAARASLRAQLLLNNADGAAVLALALSQQKGDAGLMELLLAAQFDTGHYERITLRGPDGRALFERSNPTDSGSAPRWFARWLPIETAAGSAIVSSGWQDVGRVEVSATAMHAYGTLWSAAQRTLLLLALLGAAAAASAAIGIRRLRRTLDRTLAQARAVEEGRFEIAAEPGVVEFRMLTQGMNSMVRRVQSLIDAQAAQVETLRAQVMADPLTGVPNRRNFMARLEQSLSQADAPPASGLLIVRLGDLPSINARLGRESADRLLCTVARAMQAYPERVAGAFSGRLNGADFALFLPAPAIVAETAASLVAALRGTLLAVDPRGGLVVGGAELSHGQEPAQALAAADEALARAEHGGAFCIEVAQRDDCAGRAIGERSWREQIGDALRMRRAHLAEFEVVDAQGRLLHLECPLRLQLTPGAAFEAAAAWIAMAQRIHLMPAVDRCAVELAIDAIARDGRPRCVHVATSSIATAGFIEALQQHLQANPKAASQLWIEVGEGAALECPDRVAEASRRWRRLGTRLGLEHAGGALGGLGHLHELGLDYVKIGERYVAGVASDDGVRALAGSLAALVRGIGLLALAEGVQEEEDLQALWLLGFDGATGPAVRLPAM